MIVNKKTLEDIIDYCLIPLYDDNAKVILTGTTLLCLYGLMYEFDDVDLLTRANKGYWCELLDKHQISNDEKDYSNIKIETEKFIYNIIQEDFYLEDNLISMDDLFLDTLSHSLLKKAGLKRDKDKTHFDLIKSRIDLLTKI